MATIIPDGDPFGASQKPNSTLRIAYYPRKSNKGEGGRNKSKPEQVEYCHTTSDYYGFSRNNVTI